jgi:hypothetical protein
MDTAALIALGGTLIVSIIGNVAAWWQIAAQTKKDKRQADIDDKRVKIEENKAETEKEAGDRTALLAVIETLKLEVERLQKRGIELENTVIAKTTENGELKLAAIDKEAELRTMKYNMESMQARLTAMSKKPLKGTLKKVGIEENLLMLSPEDFPSDMLTEIEEDKNRKDMIIESVNMEIEELRDNSIGNEIETQNE